jgi:hypothetical protein
MPASSPENPHTGLTIEGIGIFDNNNYVIDHLGDCVKIVKASGTHWLTWKSLEHWAGLRRSTELLAEVIQPAGLPLNDWLISFNAGTTVRPLGTRWLRTWGLDLKDLSKDRDLRNESSYRPTRLLQKAALDPVESSESLRSLWRVCEPSTAPFEPLDRYLLKMSLIEVYKGLYGTHPSQNLSLYERRTTQMVEDLGFSSSLSEEWIRYFKDFSKIQLPSSFQIPRLDPTSKIHGTMFMLQHGLFFCYVSRLGHVREHWPGRK